MNRKTSTIQDAVQMTGLEQTDAALEQMFTTMSKDVHDLKTAIKKKDKSSFVEIQARNRLINTCTKIAQTRLGIRGLGITLQKEDSRIIPAKPRKPRLTTRTRKN